MQSTRWGAKGIYMETSYNVDLCLEVVYTYNPLVDITKNNDAD